MRLPDNIKKDIRQIGCGLLIIDLITVVVFLLIHRLDYAVILGLILGTAVSLLNLIYLGLSIQKALDKGKNGKNYLHKTYLVRMLLNGACIVCAALLPCFRVIPAAIPLLTPRLIIMVLQASNRRQSKERDSENEC